MFYLVILGILILAMFFGLGTTLAMDKHLDE
jgi:hypothetical protein